MRSRMRFCFNIAVKFDFVNFFQRLTVLLQSLVLLLLLLLLSQVRDLTSKMLVSKRMQLITMSLTSRKTNLWFGFCSWLWFWERKILLRDDVPVHICFACYFCQVLHLTICLLIEDEIIWRAADKKCTSPFCALTFFPVFFFLFAQHRWMWNTFMWNTCSMFFLSLLHSQGFTCIFSALIWAVGSYWIDHLLLSFFQFSFFKGRFFRCFAILYSSFCSDWSFDSSTISSS